MDYMQIGHWSLERAMDRIGSAKRKRESPDEDEVAETLETIEITRKVVGQVILVNHFQFGISVRDRCTVYLFNVQSDVTFKYPAESLYHVHRMMWRHIHDHAASHSCPCTVRADRGSCMHAEQ